MGLTRSAKEGPVVDDWRWLRDSSGVAFLERTRWWQSALVVADLRNKNGSNIDFRNGDGQGFDVRDRQHTSIPPLILPKAR